jgi:cyclopropane-fatty-acyl-phospholipid synthase
MTLISPVDEVADGIPQEASPPSSHIYQKNHFLIELFNEIQMLGCEAYINGLELPDPVLKLILDSVFPISFKYLPFLFTPYKWLLTESENIAEGSQELMKIQYNLPAQLFKLMLEEGDLIYPKYTMALWEKGAQNLEQAQIDMVQDFIEKAEIQDGDEVLEIGCGFGGTLNYILAKFPNCKVTGLNLSAEHCKYIKEKMQDPHSYLSCDRFTLKVGDFNEVTFERKFDKIIVMGVFEHFGNLTKAFAKSASFLKKDGKMLLHLISTKLPDNMMSPFINQYIFPNGRIWSYERIPTFNKDLQVLNKWYIDSSNYSKTLQAWLINFDRYQEELKTLDYGINYPKFRRIWRLYLILCIALFDAGIIGNGQYLMSHK